MCIQRVYGVPKGAISAHRGYIGSPRGIYVQTEAVWGL